MEVPGMPVRVLEAEPAFAEVHFAGDPGVDHPLQGPVDGRAADPRVLAADQVHEVVGAQVPFVIEEHREDALALGRIVSRLPAAGGKRRERWDRWPWDIRGGRAAGTTPLNDEPHPQVDFAFGFLIVNPPPVTLSTKSTSAPSRYWALIGSTNSFTPFDSIDWSPAPGLSSIMRPYWNPEHPPPCTNTRSPLVQLLLFGQQFVDLGRGRTRIR